MSTKRARTADPATRQAVDAAMNGDLGEMFEQADLVSRRPAKMVTTLRMDLDIQLELEAAAAARGVGASTLMRQIVVEWVQTHRAAPAPDQFGELVRHLDAARQAATALAEHAA